MAQHPTNPMIPDSASDVLTPVKPSFYDRHPVLSWLALDTVVVLMAAWIAGAW